MNEKQFINLFACFIDIYSLTFMGKDDFKNKLLYNKARPVHYALQEFIQALETFDKQDEYYDFFFENIVLKEITWQDLLKKYEVLENDI